MLHLLNSMPTLVGSLLTLLLLLLLIWAIKLLKQTGSMQDLQSLSKSGSQLSKDFGSLVESIESLLLGFDQLRAENVSNLLAINRAAAAYEKLSKDLDSMLDLINIPNGLDES